MSRASKQSENTVVFGLRYNSSLPQKVNLSCTDLKKNKNKQTNKTLLSINPENSYLIFSPLKQKLHIRSSVKIVVFPRTLLGLCKILRHRGLTRAVPSMYFTSRSTPGLCKFIRERAQCVQVSFD